VQQAEEARRAQQPLAAGSPPDDLSPDELKAGAQPKLDQRRAELLADGCSPEQAARVIQAEQVAATVDAVASMRPTVAATVDAVVNMGRTVARMEQRRAQFKRDRTLRRAPARPRAGRVP
jgi:hypothetical protein